MKKMYSENQIKDIVNKGIEDGSIHADPSTEVKVSDINAESSTSGQVILSDGEGGAEWGTIQAGMEVITLATNSGTLTDEQYEKASGDNCLLKRENNYYYKAIQNDSSIIYKLIPSVNNNLILNQIDINAYTITITISSKAYGLVATSYSCVPKEEVVAYEGTSSLPTDVVFTDWTLHRAIKDGNMLWVVLCGKITNNSGASVTLASSPIIKITLPSSLSSKIYRQDGTTCNGAYSSNQHILYFTGSGGTQVGKIFRLSSVTANEIVVYIMSSIQISDGASSEIDVRIPIFLNIGTIQ